MINDENILIRYLDGELSMTEKEELEKELSNDPGLSEQLEKMRGTREAVRLYGLKQTVANVHDQMMKELAPSKTGRKSGRIIRYSIGIAASILLIVGGYMTYNFVTLSSDKVFDSKYQAYELVTLRDGNSNETAIEKAYREKDFKQVMKLHDDQKTHTNEEDFITGVAALELKDNSKAIENFKKVTSANLSSPKPSFDDEADYYLALAYIRNKDFDQALDLLKSIKQDPEHLYNEKVTGKFIRQVKMLKWK